MAAVILVPMTTHTIPAELFLLLTNDAGRQDATVYRKQAVAAAALAELALRERITISEERAPRAHLVDATPTGLPGLDQALAAIAEHDGKKIQSLIGHRALDLTETIGAVFVAEGVVQRKDGWFTTTWPTHDDTVETALRARLAGALRDRRAASLQDGILLEILRALSIAHRILKDDVPELSRRDIDRTIKALEIDHPVAKAVKKLIEDMTMMVISAAT